MKRLVFIGLSIIMFGITIVSCTSDNECVLTSEMEELQMINASVNTELEWNAFNQALDSLNKKYLPNQSLNKKQLTGHTFVPKAISYADAVGAVKGLEIVDRLPNGQFQVEPTTVIFSVINSLDKYKEYLDLETTSTPLTPIRNIKSILNLYSNSPYADLGLKHNIIISDLLSRNGVMDMSDQELVDLIIVLYEKCFSAIWPSTKSFLRSANYFSPPTASSNVMQTNLQFSAIIYPMSAVTKRNYTDDYLSLVDSTLSDNLEKCQIMSYASVMYYSESLWLIDY